MKKLFMLAAGMAATAGAFGQVEGTYNSYFLVDPMGDGDTWIRTTAYDVTLTKDETGDTYTLSIKDFAFSGKDNSDYDNPKDYPAPEELDSDEAILIGDLELKNVSIDSEGNLTAPKAMGPLVNMMGADLPTRINLDKGHVGDGVLSIKLIIDVLSDDDTSSIELQPVVLFDNSRTNGVKTLFEVASEGVSISGDQINVPQGSDYVLVNVNGAILLKGNAQNGEIAISRLGHGVYFLNVNGTSVKFIR